MNESGHASVLNRYNYFRVDIKHKKNSIPSGRTHLEQPKYVFITASRLNNRAPLYDSDIYILWILSCHSLSPLVAMEILTPRLIYTNIKAHRKNTKEY